MGWLESLNETKQELEAELAAIKAANEAEALKKNRKARMERVNNLCALLEWLDIPTDGIRTDYSGWTGNGEPPVDYLPEQVVVDGYVFTGNIETGELERRVTQKSGIVDPQKSRYVKFSLAVTKEVNFTKPREIRSPIYIAAPEQPHQYMCSGLESNSYAQSIDLADEIARRIFKARLAELIQRLDAVFPAYVNAAMNWDNKVRHRIDAFEAAQAAQAAEWEANRLAQEEADRAWREEQRAHAAARQEQQKLEEERRAAYRAEIAAAFGISTEA